MATGLVSLITQALKSGSGVKVRFELFKWKLKLAYQVRLMLLLTHAFVIHLILFSF
jgi:hypothetical protein